jgi:hypothetical protein
MIEEGTHPAKALKAELGVAGTGKEQVAITFALTQSNQRITWYGYFTEKAFEYTMRALETCGFRGSDLSDLSGIDGSFDVDLVIEHEADDKGNPRAKVRWVNEPGRGALAKPLEQGQAAEFASRMKAKILALKAQRPAAAQTKRAPAPAEVGADEDIPF